MNRPATIDHETSAQIDQAAEWLRSQPVPPRPAVPALQRAFGLTPIEACLAIAAARSLPVRRASNAA